MEPAETLYQQGEDFEKGICVERNEVKAVALYEKKRMTMYCTSF